MKTETYRISRVLTPIATALLLAITPYSALAEKHEHDHDKEKAVEQHGSHEHGAARLTVAATDDGVEIMLESPAANIFGFEHQAKSEAEHDVVHEALEVLKGGATLFAVNDAAACKLESANVESAIGENHDDEKHGEDDEHKHEKEEKHDKHDEHSHEEEKKHDDHDHDAHTDEEGSHSDVEAIWAFHCDKPGAIETVTVKLFSAFPKGFEEIDVEWISAANAGKVELTADGAVSLKE